MISVLFDPNKQHPHLNFEQELKHHSLLLSWAEQYDSRIGKTVTQYLTDCYGFGSFPSDHLKKNIKLQENFAYQYPGDPIQHPILVVGIPKDNEDAALFIIYPSAMVIIVEDDNFVFGRMD